MREIQETNYGAIRSSKSEARNKYEPAKDKISKQDGFWMSFEFLYFEFVKLLRISIFEFRVWGARDFTRRRRQNER